jgi:hypothetical protein|tara:strand:+ start:76 stop:291 length:216 start_codon:yes stop_codon:yes gene_type:complete
MSKELHRSLLPLVNEHEQMKRLQIYVEYRIEVLRDQLETISDPAQFKSFQGSIRELRRFKTLREEVLKGAE